MTDWQVVWLGVMAVSLLTMTVIQIGLIVVVLRLAGQVSATAAELRREIRPLVDKANRIADDTAKTTAIMVAQAERIDQLASIISVRVDDTLQIVQGLVAGPVRRGGAIVAGVRAAMAVLKYWRGRERTVHEDEEQLFVG